MKNFFLTLLLILLFSPLGFAQETPADGLAKPSDALPVGTNFTVRGDNEVEVTTTASDLASPEDLAERLAGAGRVDILSLETGDDPTADTDIARLQASLKENQSDLPLTTHRERVALSTNEAKVSALLVGYQHFAARSTWTVFKIASYTVGGWYLVFRSSGYFDWAMPAMTVFIAGICAYKIDAVNAMVENFRLVYPLVNKIKTKSENSVLKKVVLALSRLVDPFVGTAVFESAMYYFILQAMEWRQSSIFPFEHDPRSALDLVKVSVGYGVISFFGDYSLAVALQKATIQSKKLSVLFKHAFNYHAAIIISLAIFAGNMAENAGWTWTKPVLITTSWIGTLGYAYVKLPVLKALTAGLLSWMPGLKNSSTLKSWLESADFERDFIDNVPKLHVQYPRQVALVRRKTRALIRPLKKFGNSCLLTLYKAGPLPL